MSKYPKTLGRIEAVWNKLGGEDGVDRFLRGELVVSEPTKKLIPVEFVIDFDKDPSTPKDLTVLSEKEQLPNRVRGQMKFDSTKVSIYLNDGQKGNGIIRGPELCKKLIDIPVYGVQLLDFYLANAHLIPKEWKGKVVFFWGTIYSDSDGVLYIRCIDWDGRKWSSHYRWFSGGWQSSDVAVVSASYFWSL